MREYEEAFTTLLMQQGLPKMTARVLTSLFIADAGSLTASELAQHLQVSPASVSKAIAFLEARASSGGNATNAAASATSSTATSGTS